MGRKVALSITLGSFAALLGCGGSSSGNAPMLEPVSISLSSNSTTLPLSSSSPTLSVTVQRAAGDTNPVTLTVTSVPGSVTPQITSPGTGIAGSIAFSANAAATPGTYSLTVNATEGGPNATAALALTVLSAPVTVNVTVSPTVNTSVGFGGQMQTFYDHSVPGGRVGPIVLSVASGRDDYAGKSESGAHSRLHHQ